MNKLEAGSLASTQNPEHHYFTTKNEFQGEMNYNPNAGIRNRKLEGSAGRVHATQGSGPRKMLRVVDPSAAGAPSNPYSAQNSMPPNAMPDPMMSSNNVGGFQAPMSAYSNSNPMPMQQPIQQPNYGFQSTMPTAVPPSQAPFPSNNLGPQRPAYSGVPNNPNMPVGGGGGAAVPPQFAVFQEPIVQDMAMQYGQRLADQGKQIMENQFEKWVPVAKLKYYFAVDNKYVVNKLRLLFFPFLHKDWSLKYDQENPVQPRYDINAPDLYIPSMAYITYVVVAGLMLIMQNRFTPEQLGIQASSALAYSIFELVVYSITLYVVNIKTNLKTLDLVSFSGYKFVIIVTSLLVSTLFHRSGYYLTLIYSSFALGLFLLRTLKTKVLNDTAPASASGPINYDPYGNPQQLDYSGGRKRKLYFLFLIVGGQAFLSWLLSQHLYFPDPGLEVAAAKL